MSHILSACSFSSLCLFSLSLLLLYSDAAVGSCLPLVLAMKDALHRLLLWFTDMCLAGFFFYTTADQFAWLQRGLRLLCALRFRDAKDYARWCARGRAYHHCAAYAERLSRTRRCLYDLFFAAVVLRQRRSGIASPLLLRLNQLATAHFYIRVLLPIHPSPTAFSPPLLPACVRATKLHGVFLI